MSGVKQLSDYVDTKVAVGPNVTSGAITGTMIDATGFRRAHFVFSFGTPEAGASVLSGAGIWEASTSGATFALLAGAQFTSSITTSQGSNGCAVIDTVVTAASPWLLVSGYSMVNSNWLNSVTVQLYNFNTATPGTVVGATPTRIITL